MSNQDVKDLINQNFNISESKLKKGLKDYFKETGVIFKPSQTTHPVYFDLKEDKNNYLKNSYLESLSFILKPHLFEVYKYLLEYDLSKEEVTNQFKVNSKELNLNGISSKIVNSCLNTLSMLGLIYKQKSKHGSLVALNYEFVYNNLLINNLYNTKSFFDKLTDYTLKTFADRNYGLNDFIKEKVEVINKSILDNFKVDFSEDQINMVLAKLYQTELNYKAKKVAFTKLDKFIYVYYNLKEHVTNRDLQILNYLVLKGVIGCLNINGINRYRIIDKSTLNMDTVTTLEKETEVVEEVEVTNSIADEVDTGSLTPKQSAAIIKSLDKFLDSNDLDVSDNKYKSFLRYGYYLKSRGVSEFTFVSYLKEMVSQNFDEEKLNYVITDMINKNFTNIFNYLEKNNMSTKTNKLYENGNVETSKSTNPLSKLTREEFMKLQEGRKDGKLYEEINEYKAQGKTEADYIKDKIGVDITKR